jgi:hypothetical protein
MTYTLTLLAQIETLNQAIEPFAKYGPWAVVAVLLLSTLYGIKKYFERQEVKEDKFTEERKTRVDMLMKIVENNSVAINNNTAAIGQLSAKMDTDTMTLNSLRDLMLGRPCLLPENKR